MSKAAPKQPAEQKLSPLRARTRDALIDSALRRFAEKGIGATAIHEIAEGAAVSNGSFYNYFRTREEIVEAAVRSLSTRLSAEISSSYIDVADPAERVAIGSRQFMLKALRDRQWGAAVLSVWNSTPDMARRVNKAALDDLRAGRAEGRFNYRSEQAAVDLLQGAVLAGMRSVLESPKGKGEKHAAEVAELILCGLGLTVEDARAVVGRPLPPIVQGSSLSDLKKGKRA